jgi:hypothetical protein
MNSIHQELYHRSAIHYCVYYSLAATILLLLLLFLLLQHSEGRCGRRCRGRGKMHPERCGSRSPLITDDVFCVPRIGTDKQFGTQKAREKLQECAIGVA